MKVLTILVLMIGISTPSFSIYPMGHLAGHSGDTQLRASSRPDVSREGTWNKEASAEQRYGQCMAMARRSPDRAIDQALSWIAEGGGVPARHCEAVGLYFGGEYKEAAIRLEGLVDDMRVGRDMPLNGRTRMVASPSLMADMFGQAANAWLIADEIDRAHDAIAAALSLAPDKSPLQMALLVDRARISAADEDYTQALADLEQVRLNDSGRKDILIFIVSAKRALGAYGQAVDVLAEYQSAYPNDPVGYLEKGHLADILGDKDQARQAYLKVIEIAGPDSLITRDARSNIERLAHGNLEE